MSSSRNHGSNCNQNQGSSSNSRQTYWSSGSNPYARSYAGNPYSRYSTGPFSYRNPSTTARCTSSYQSYTCGHVSSPAVRRVASCAACTRGNSRQCIPTPIQVEIAAKCISCQPSHRQGPNGDLKPLTWRDRIEEVFQEWQQNSNIQGDSDSDS